MLDLYLRQCLIASLVRPPTGEETIYGLLRIGEAVALVGRFTEDQQYNVGTTPPAAPESKVPLVCDYPLQISK
jgi:hypothetical protein